MANLNELRDALRGQPATFLRDCMIAILDDVSTLSSRVMAHRDLLAETPTRVDQLAAQLAGLQRLVESLVNERDEGRQEAADDESRCAICGWPLKERIDEGCVRTNCSQRPRPDKMYAPQRFALEQVRFRADRTDADRNQLQAEAMQLTKERQAAVSLAESRRVQAQAVGDTLISAVTKRDELAAEVDRLTTLAESRWKWAHDVAGVAESQTVEAIAAWLEQRAQAILTPNRHCLEAQHRAAGLTDAVDDLRAGTWREQP